MKHLYKLSFLVLSFFLLTACKKNKFDSTGTLVLSFKNGMPRCFTLYTEEGYSGSRLYIISYPNGTAGSGLALSQKDDTYTIAGLNYGTYVITFCPGGSKVVQVAAGKSRTYDIF
jgi:hypothetical protein